MGRSKDKEVALKATRSNISDEDSKEDDEQVATTIEKVQEVYEVQ